MTLTQEWPSQFMVVIIRQRRVIPQVGKMLLFQLKSLAPIKLPRVTIAFFWDDMRLIKIRSVNTIHRTLQYHFYFHAFKCQLFSPRLGFEFETSAGKTCAYVNTGLGQLYNY